MLTEWLFKKGSYRVLTIIVIATIVGICIGFTLFINKFL